MFGSQITLIRKRQNWRDTSFPRSNLLLLEAFFLLLITLFHICLSESCRCYSADLSSAFRKGCIKGLSSSSSYYFQEIAHLILFYIYLSVLYFGLSSKTYLSIDVFLYPFISIFLSIFLSISISISIFIFIDLFIFIFISISISRSLQVSIFIFPSLFNFALLFIYLRGLAVISIFVSIFFLMTPSIFLIIFTFPAVFIFPSSSTYFAVTLSALFFISPLLFRSIIHFDRLPYLYFEAILNTFSDSLISYLFLNFSHFESYPNINSLFISSAIHILTLTYQDFSFHFLFPCVILSFDVNLYFRVMLPSV